MFDSAASIADERHFLGVYIFVHMQQESFKIIKRIITSNSVPCKTTSTTTTTNDVEGRNEVNLLSRVTTVVSLI